MRRKLTFTGIVIFVLTLSLGIAAAEKINFSGTWTMDRGRSMGLPADMNQVMTITHTGDKIQLETRLITSQGERTVSDSYTLNGKEAEFTPPSPPGAPVPKGKRTANWLPRGNGILVNEETITETPNGQVKSQMARKWILSPDGTTLTIDLYIDNPNGSFETKRIFVKK